MRDRICVTIAGGTAERLRQYALRERRPVSQVVEMAVERFLAQNPPVADLIVTSRGAFRGRFSREETHAGL